MTARKRKSAQAENSPKQPGKKPVPKAQRKRPPTKGSWKPGQSGNPGGRPKTNAQIRDLCRESGEDMVKNLVALARDKKQHGTTRVSASNAVLNRAYGHPPQAITGEGGGPVRFKGDYSKLNNKELETLAKLMQKALKDAGAGADS